jgi:hypothetical protein
MNFICVGHPVGVLEGVDEADIIGGCAAYPSSSVIALQFLLGRLDADRKPMRRKLTIAEADWGGRRRNPLPS